MKIKSIMLKNFAKVSELSISLDDNITYLIGENGSGKTTIGLNAVWFTLKGMSVRNKDKLYGERFRFIKNEDIKTIGKLVLHDEENNIDITITRTMTAKQSRLKIIASDNRVLDTDFITDIFNVFSINPEAFADLSAQEQSLKLGVDTTDYDRINSIKYENRKEANYLLKNAKTILDNIDDVDKVEKISITTLVKKRSDIILNNQRLTDKANINQEQAIQKAIQFNKEQDQNKSALSEINNKLIKIKKLKLELESERMKIPNSLAHKSTNILLVQPEQISTKNIDNEILQAEDQNKKFDEYSKFKKAKITYESVKDIALTKDNDYKSALQNRINYLKSCNLPLSNMTIDNNGGLLVNDRPFSPTYFSKGEIITLSIAIISTLKPKLKYIFIPNSQNLDDKNKKIIFRNLTGMGYQVVAEHVGTKALTDHTSIIITGD